MGERTMIPKIKCSFDRGSLNVDFIDRMDNNVVEYIRSYLNDWVNINFYTMCSKQAEVQVNFEVNNALYHWVNSGNIFKNPNGVWVGKNLIKWEVEDDQS